MSVNDRAFDRSRTVGAPDSVPEQHEDVARGADTMADYLTTRALEFESQGDLLSSQTASRQAERHRQLAGYHRDQAERRREQAAGHPSTWVDTVDSIKGAPEEAIDHGHRSQGGYR